MRRYAALALALSGAITFVEAQSAERALETDAVIGQVSFSGDSIRIIGIGQDRAARIWDVQSGNLLRTVSWDKQYRFGVTVSLQGDLLAAGGPDKSVKLWNLSSGELAHQLAVQPQEPRGAAKFSADGKLLATGHLREQVRVWEIPSGKLRFTAPSGVGDLSSLAFSPDGTILVGAANDTNIHVWRAQDGQLIRVIDELQLLTRSVRFTPNGAFLISAGVDQRVYVWSTQTWKRVREFDELHPESIASMDLSADGRLLVTGGLDVTDDDNAAHLVLWNVESGKVLKRTRLAHAVTSVAFSPDGRWVAAANRQKSVLLWRVSELMDERKKGSSPGSGDRK